MPESTNLPILTQKSKEYQENTIKKIYKINPTFCVNVFYSQNFLTDEILPENFEVWMFYIWIGLFVKQIQNGNCVDL